MIDTASGSCGFTVHTIFQITGHLFENAEISAEEKYFQPMYEEVVKAIKSSKNHASLVSRLISSLSLYSAETGHFPGGVKLPPRRFADPLRGATPPPSNSPAVVRLFVFPVWQEICETHNLGEIVSIEKCVEPGSEVYQDGGVPFLRVSNLSKLGINTDNQQFLSEALYDSLKTHQPKKSEILLSKDATPGIAYYLKDAPGKMIPSGGILRLTIRDAERVYPEYLTLVLSSVIVQKQIERDAGGSIINHWLVDQVKSALIPILPVSAQKQIAEKVDQSFSDRERSKGLLDIAKRGVEMAIEKNEKDAQSWMDAELKKLSIRLE